MKLNQIFLLITLHLLLVACGSNQQKPDIETVDKTITSEPIKPEPAKPEPVKPEPVKPEPVKPEPVKPEPVKPEPIKPVPVKPEPVKPEPVKPEPVKPEPVKPEPVKPEPVKPEPVKPEPVKPEPVNVTPTKTISGSIELDQSKLDRMDAEITSTFVYFEPLDRSAIKISPTNTSISTLNKRFEPNALAITVGSDVAFPNMDRILHNVFSVSPKSQFDLGLYSAGTTKTVTFENPGVIYVHCNVHHSMQADILVLDTPYFTRVDEQGRFKLTGIADTEGMLKIWHPRGNIKTITLSDSSQVENIQQQLTITRPKVPKHTNKFGKSYRPTRGGE